MRKIKVLKLGQFYTDKATELEGMLTHWLYAMDGSIYYHFQPNGLSLEGYPMKRLVVELQRLVFTEQDFEDVLVQDEILETYVKVKGSGFSGMAISLLRHINGCFHVFIQPKGINARTGAPIPPIDFDIRLCEGEKIPKFSTEELKKSEERTPSPMGEMSEVGLGRLQAQD